MRLLSTDTQNHRMFPVVDFQQEKEANSASQASNPIFDSARDTVSFSGGRGEKRYSEESSTEYSSTEGLASKRNHVVETPEEAPITRSLSQIFGNPNDFPIFSNEELAQENILIPGVNTASPEFSYDLLKGQAPPLARVLAKLHNRTMRLIFAEAYILARPEDRRPWENKMREEPERFETDLLGSVARRNAITPKSEVFDQALWDKYIKPGHQAYDYCFDNIFGLNNPTEARQLLEKSLEAIERQRIRLAENSEMLESFYPQNTAFNEPQWQNRLISLEKTQVQALVTGAEKRQFKENNQIPPTVSEHLNRSAESALAQLKHQNPTLGEMVGKLKDKTLRCISADKFLSQPAYQDLNRRLLSAENSGKEAVRQELIKYIQDHFDEKERHLAASEELNLEDWQAYEKAKLMRYAKELGAPVTE